MSLCAVAKKIHKIQTSIEIAVSWQNSILHFFVFYSVRVRFFFQCYAFVCTLSMLIELERKRVETKKYFAIHWLYEKKNIKKSFVSCVTHALKHKSKRNFMQILFDANPKNNNNVQCVCIYQPNRNVIDIHSNDGNFTYSQK